MLNSRAVHVDRQHIDNRGDHVERKYDATYHYGNTVVHIIAPPPMTYEKKQAVLREYDRAFWAAWKSLSVEEQLAINASCKD